MSIGSLGRWEGCMLQVLEALDLDLVAVAEVDYECLFFGADICFG